jgi:excisionase family DNA binding protein
MEPDALLDTWEWADLDAANERAPGSASSGLRCVAGVRVAGTMPAGIASNNDIVGRRTALDLGQEGGLMNAAEIPHGAGEWLTAKEAAAYLRLPSVKALYQRRARGQIKAFALGRSLRFRRRDLDALMSQDGRP